MTREAQKRKEWRAFSLFKELLRSELEEDLICTNLDHKEDPDFWLTQSTGMLGIEHTRLFKTSDARHSPAQKEQYKRNILRLARSMCEARRTPPTKVEVSFHASIEQFSGKHGQQQLAQRLADFVADWAKQNLADSSNVLKPMRELPPVARIKLKAGISNGKKWLHSHRWELWKGVRVSVSFIDVLQAAIDHKNSRYNDYLRNCDSCWLLVVADKRNQAQAFEMIDLDGYPKDHRYSSRFERTFFMEVTERCLVELNCVSQG